MDHVRELPRAGAVRVWLVDTETPSRIGPMDGAGVLDADELRRAAAFRFDRDRERYMAAHLALRGILGEQLGRAPGEVHFVRQPCPDCGKPHGRPALADAPRLHFSLSHSGDRALVALAAAPVGADVEEVPSRTIAEELATVLHPREQAELASLDDPLERRTAVARVWVRKEAYLKGLGIGLARRTDLDYVGSVPGSPVAPDGWTVHDVPMPEGYAAAVALSPRS
ncbi:4'-phosphopantetheinyl transferase family protein [Streptomyces sp. NPDC050085]|uniref:4'-phosphopantetheinyl transferase family protein n=1 Tax=Streptomyces sp. NPDC050085 TaxID=3365600 RepID=UPI003798429B